MLDQPQSSLVLPEDLQKAIDSARVNLSILESKCAITNTTNISLLKDNATLIKQQEYVTSQIADLQTTIDKNTAIIAGQNIQIDFTNTTLSSLDTEIENKKTEQTNRENDYNSRLATLVDRENIVKDQEAQLALDRNLQDSIENKFSEKLAKLKDCIDNLIS